MAGPVPVDVHGEGQLGLGADGGQGQAGQYCSLLSPAYGHSHAFAISYRGDWDRALPILARVGSVFL